MYNLCKIERQNHTFVLKQKTDGLNNRPFNILSSEAILAKLTKILCRLFNIRLRNHRRNYRSAVNTHTLKVRHSFLINSAIITIGISTAALISASCSFVTALASVLVLVAYIAPTQGNLHRLPVLF